MSNILSRYQVLSVYIKLEQDGTICLTTRHATKCGELEFITKHFQWVLLVHELRKVFAVHGVLLLKHGL